MSGDGVRSHGTPLLTPSARTLEQLTEQQRAERFTLLQRKLPEVWGATHSNREGESIVVVPSMPLDKPGQASEQLVMEERFLFLLLLLRQPRLRLIYVTSLPIEANIIDYYLGLLAGVIPSHAKARLSLVAARDRSSQPLSAKILARPALVHQIRQLIPNPDLCHLVPYATTTLERDLALELGIPIYGADPRFLTFGTKTGSRRLFAAAGVRHPLGFEDLRDLAGIADALAGLRASQPSIEHAIVKLNEGASGDGNASVDLSRLPPPGAIGEAEELAERVRQMSFENADVTFDAYLRKLEQGGGVVEERIVGGEIRSPSVQLRITPVGDVELLSTHDQLLGGPSGQMYLGCRFPAAPAYAVAITAEAAKIGALLAREGVIGRFALDFVVARDADSGWTPYAIELNLRKGGTTHPFLTLEFLTDGTYEAAKAVFAAPSGQPKFLVATDHFESSLLRGLTHEDLFDIVVRHRLQFDQSRQTGIVFHLIGALTDHGRVGLTAVGDTPDEADAIYREAEAVLMTEAQCAMQPALLPAL